MVFFLSHIVSYLPSFAQMLHGLLVGDSLEVNPIHLQHPVACYRELETNQLPVSLSNSESAEGLRVLYESIKGLIGVASNYYK